MAGQPTIKSVELPPSLADVAFKAIKEAILESRLESGRVYSEQALAKDLGFSKTPVHEALVSLSTKGFVKILPRRGFIVIDLTPSNVAHMFEFRVPLEILVIKKITPLLDDTDIGDIEQYLTGMRTTRDPAKFQQYDRSFHRHLAYLTQNPYIIHALNDIWDLCDWVGALVLTRQGKYELAVEEHTAIAEQLRKRDAGAAAKALQAHLKSTEKKFIHSI